MSCVYIYIYIYIQAHLVGRRNGGAGSTARFQRLQEELIMIIIILAIIMIVIVIIIVIVMILAIIMIILGTAPRRLRRSSPKSRSRLRDGSIRERGSAPKRARHSTIFAPASASVQWQPDGLTIHTKQWFLGAGFL